LESTEENIADIFTKALPKDKNDKFTKVMSYDRPGGHDLKGYDIGHIGVD